METPQDAGYRIAELVVLECGRKMVKPFVTMIRSHGVKHPVRCVENNKSDDIITTELLKRDALWQAQITELEKTNTRLQGMVDNGLGPEDMVNDISKYPDNN